MAVKRRERERGRGRDVGTDGWTDRQTQRERETDRDRWVGKGEIFVPMQHCKTSNVHHI